MSAARTLKIYIHRLARGCCNHLKSNEWLGAAGKLLSRNDFESEQIEDLFDLLTDKKFKAESAIESKRQCNFSCTIFN